MIHSLPECPTQQVIAAYSFGLETNDSLEEHLLLCGTCCAAVERFELSLMKLEGLINATETASAAPQILVIEDSPSDLFLIKQALQDYSTAINVTAAMDGEEAIQLLRSIGRDVPRPDLVLLDLNLPKRSGFEVLNSLRDHPGLQTIPVAILSSSHASMDIEKAYRDGANCYVKKAATWEGFSRTISTLCSFWFEAAALPVPG